MGNQKLRRERNDGLVLVGGLRLVSSRDRSILVDGCILPDVRLDIWSEFRGGVGMDDFSVADH